MRHLLPLFYLFWESPFCLLIHSSNGCHCCLIHWPVAVSLSTATTDLNKVKANVPFTELAFSCSPELPSLSVVQFHIHFYFWAAVHFRQMKMLVTWLMFHFFFFFFFFIITVTWPGNQVHTGHHPPALGAFISSPTLVSTSSKSNKCPIVWIIFYFLSPQPALNQIPSRDSVSCFINQQITE